MEEQNMWLDFPVYASVAILCWLAASGLFLYSGKKLQNQMAAALTFSGIVVLAIFVVLLWMHLKRPPMRTMGETRLWYAVFLSSIGLVTYQLWKYKWLISYSLGLAVLFLIFNLQHPEAYDKTLMPALQSPWFIPHVIVYIFAYALLGASSLLALRNIFFAPTEKTIKGPIQMADNLVYLGFAFLTLGLLFGALWAKEAWGHYWTWDPKETWAFITWMFYLVYIHYRFRHPSEHKKAMIVLAVAFVVLLICWFGVNYLPSAQNSVHVYSE
ncbi:MAG: cytochrome c biogenesis protein CcsA [Prolixibacteraceae bacterium]|jgi:cytochrome c-type biogenesis protein CcsB